MTFASAFEIKFVRRFPPLPFPFLSPRAICFLFPRRANKGEGECHFPAPLSPSQILRFCTTCPSLLVDVRGSEFVGAFNAGCEVAVHSWGWGGVGLVVVHRSLLTSSPPPAFLIRYFFFSSAPPISHIHTYYFSHVALLRILCSVVSPPPQPEFPSPVSVKKSFFSPLPRPLPWPQGIHHHVRGVVFFFSAFKKRPSRIHPKKGGGVYLHLRNNNSCKFTCAVIPSYRPIARRLNCPAL